MDVRILGEVFDVPAGAVGGEDYSPALGFTSTTFMSASSRRALRIVSGDTPYSDASTDRP